MTRDPALDALRAGDPREYRREIVRRYHARNPEKVRALIREKNRRYRVAHPKPDRRVVSQEYYRKNKAHCGAKMRRNYQQNKERYIRQSTAWRKAHPMDFAASSRKCKLQRKYGLTVADYEALLVAQSGRCAICRKKPEKVRLAVDHDHVTGKVRGLLCTCCNTALGKFNDDVNLFQTAIDYLERAKQ
jgi:hypothetical protein